MKWPIVPLDALAEIVGGSTPRRDETAYWGAGYYWATPTDLPMPGEGILDLEKTAQTITPAGLRSCSTNLLPVGAVLYSTRATIGKLAIAKVPVTTNQGFNNLIPGPAVYNRYLAYALQFFTPDIACLAGSTTFKEVSRSSLRGFKIPVPPISEQHRMVELLDEADRLRRLRSEADAKAARIMPSLFLKMFGDPATNPMGWNVRRIGNLGKVQTGNTPPRAKLEYYGDAIEWIKSDNLNTPSHYVSKASERLSEQGRRVARTTPAFSTLVTCIAGSPGCIGNAALCTTEVAFNQQINAIAPNDGVDPMFLYAQTVVGKKLIQAASTGAMKGMVNKSRFEEIPFLNPPPDLQALFGRLCTDALASIELAMSAGNKIELLLSVLLQNAFSGQLTSKWREVHMKELLAEMEQQARLLNLPIPKEAEAIP